MARTFIDCREIPSDIKCTIAIAADTKDELLDAAVAHAVTTHHEKDTPELRKMIREGMHEGTLA